MEIRGHKSLERVNFSDNKVFRTEIDEKNKSVTFYISGGCRLAANTRICFEDGELHITGYRSFSATSYNAKNDQEVTLSIDKLENLGEICEIDVYNEKLVIKGFALASGNWLEFNIEGGIVKGSFKD